MLSLYQTASMMELQNAAVDFMAMGTPMIPCATTGGSMPLGWQQTPTYDALQMNQIPLRDEVGMSRANLIVNYLPQNMGESEVRILFQPHGELESCKLIRDKNTGASMGYAFVQYRREEDAAKAIQALNSLRVQNKTIKVSLARPSCPQIKGANLYISNLPKSMSQPQLEYMFSKCGKIITSRILVDQQSGLSRGIGFIRFDHRAEAEKAIADFHGFVPEGCLEAMSVKFANPPNNNAGGKGVYVSQQRTATGGPLMHPRNAFRLVSAALPYAVGNDVLHGRVLPNPNGWPLFVYNLAPDAGEQGLWELFGPFGAVTSVRVIRDKDSAKCKGYGFVTMPNPDEAALAIASLNGSIHNNRMLQVSFKTNNRKGFSSTSSSP